MHSTTLASIKRELAFKVRSFDEQAEDLAVSEYCQKYAPQGAELIINVFRESRKTLRPVQGETRKMWIQAMQLGDVYIAAMPAEFFTVLGLEIKRRSPFRNTQFETLANKLSDLRPLRATATNTQPVGLGYVNCYAVGPKAQKTRNFKKRKRGAISQVPHLRFGLR